MADPRDTTLAAVREALRTRDAAPLAAVLADDARWYGRGGGGGCLSRDEVLATLRGTFEHGIEIELLDERLSGDGHAVLHVVLTGGEEDEEESGEAWYLLDLRDDGAITEIAVYSSARSVEHDLSLRATGAGARGDATPPPTVSALVAFVHVADVERSVAFYRHLGFTTVDTFEPGGFLHWAFLESEGAQLMLARADEPVDHRAQSVLFYLYAQDLAGLRDDLVAAGLAPGEIFDGTPGPKQELRLADPDGYILMIAQIESEE